MLKIIAASIVALCLSLPVTAAKEVRETTIVVGVAGTIHVAKPSLDVKFKEYQKTLLKADMDWEIYWALNTALQIEYECLNNSNNPKGDMCSKIHMEIDSLHYSQPDKLILSTANPLIVIPARTRFGDRPWDTQAYLDINGLEGGEHKATGRLILSAKI
ncbi:hypothetical protein AB6E21_16215 [Photobacterium swingsii]|uniref:hypothetical protein n=1 Tax=Photobacterium swingsii TaxID=680026 RepID=UPI00354CC063